MRMSKLTAVLMALVLIGLTTSVAYAQDPANGQTIWEEQVWQCSMCHGAMGEGMWGRPLSNSNLTAQEWIDQVRNPRQNMPAFSEAQVTDEQIIDIHAYVTSLPEPADFTRADPGLPADAPEGQVLIAQKNCIACHTETGPINRFINRGERPTVEAVIAQLRSPQERMPMFSEDQVSDAEAALIADFLAQQFDSQAGDETGDEAEAPATLPQSGGTPTSPLVWLALGTGLLLIGLAAWRRRPVL